MIISSNGSLVVNISSASVDDRQGERKIEDFARYHDPDDDEDNCDDDDGDDNDNICKVYYGRLLLC